jgi:serine/threonine protein kinase
MEIQPDKEMTVYETYEYKKQIKNGKKYINEFEVIKELGRGCFWKVYLAQRDYEQDGRLDKNLYVFKEGSLSEKKNKYNLKLSLSQSEEVFEEERAIGENEFYILRNVNHKNIARLYECVRHYKDDLILLIMEYADLGDLMIVNDMEESYKYNHRLINFILRDCLQSDLQIELTDEISFSQHHEVLIPVAKYILKSLVEALDYLHDRLIVHKDIKPQNISLKTEDKQIKLFDFSHSVQLLTYKEIETQVGTSQFDPPEILQEYKYDPFKGDIYSLAVTIYVFLFNSLEINMEKEKDKFLLLLHEKSPEFFDLLFSMINSDPQLRLSTKDILGHKIFFK